jgi:hypothetical protein
MDERIIAEEALYSIVAQGRTLREAAAFLSEQCYELRLHAWAYVNTDALEPIPHHIWPALMWFALPDEYGVIKSNENNEISIVGNWIDGRISYCPKIEGPSSRRYNIQGIRFDRQELESVKQKARQWSSKVIGAGPLPRSGGRHSSRAPVVKLGRPPSDALILAKADEMHDKDMTGYAISGQMRREPGFENVATTTVRTLINGRYPRGPRKSKNTP